jgi:hypothetical protein
MTSRWLLNLSLSSDLTVDALCLERMKVELKQMLLRHRPGVANREDRELGRSDFCSIIICIYFVPVFSHGTEWVSHVCCYHCRWAVSTPLFSFVTSSYQGAGGLFDYVNETGTRTQVKGTPTNKKQTQPDVTSVHTAHFQWCLLPSSNPRSARKIIMQNGK